MIGQTLGRDQIDFAIDTSAKEAPMRLRVMSFAIVVAALALSVACTAPAPAGLTDADRTAINAAEQNSVKAVNNKDWEIGRAHV